MSSNSSSNEPSAPASAKVNPAKEMKGRLIVAAVITLIVAGAAELLVPRGGISARFSSADFALFFVFSVGLLYLEMTWEFAGTFVPDKYWVAVLFAVPVIALGAFGGFESRPSPARAFVPQGRAPYVTGYATTSAGSGSYSSPFRTSRWVDAQRSCSSCSGSGRKDVNCYRCDSGTIANPAGPGYTSCHVCGGDGRKEDDCPSCTNGTIYERKEVFE